MGLRRSDQSLQLRNYIKILDYIEGRAIIGKSTQCRRIQFQIYISSSVDVYIYSLIQCDPCECLGGDVENVDLMPSVDGEQKEVEFIMRVLKTKFGYLKNMDLIFTLFVGNDFCLEVDQAAQTSSPRRIKLDLRSFQLDSAVGSLLSQANLPPEASAGLVSPLGRAGQVGCPQYWR